MRLTPTETRFFPLFSQAADNLAAATDLLSELIAVSAEDRPPLASKIRDLEHEGDETTHRIMRLVNATFVTPFDRQDIYRLASGLDDCVDFVEAAADLTVLYGLGDLPGETRTIVDVLRRAARATAEAMPRLRDPGDLEDYWIEVNELENEADQVYRRLVARLFSGADDALTVLKLKDVIEELEAAAGPPPPGAEGSRWSSAHWPARSSGIS
ncbi:MAG: DUF47 domain-containing protein [Streptosporangiaceae bacterium]